MLTPDVIGAIQAHAIAEYPREACGLVLRGDAGGQEYLPCRNINADPEREFEIAAEHWLRYEGRILAVMHSHPHRPQATPPAPARDWPSEADMQGQIDSALPWGIVLTDGAYSSVPFLWGDSLTIPALQGREFRHGVADCYNGIRDCGRLGAAELTRQGLIGWPFADVFTLPNFVRGGEWWSEGKDLYRSFFAAAGYERVSQPRPGDVFLAQVRSPVPNHGGVLLERGLIFHHLQFRLSRVEPLGGWARFVTHWLRYTGHTEGVR
jgi:proteasome lid subunit RPN8/RPN11